MMGDVANNNNLQSEQQMSDDLSFHEFVPTKPVNTPTGLMNDSARESEEADLIMTTAVEHTKQREYERCI